VLAQCCDYRVCTDDARTRLGLNEVALGACFPPRILRILLHRLPSRSHHEVLLGAGLFAPEAARAVGLVDAVSSDAEADARGFLERAARHPRTTYAHTKRLLNAGAAASEADLARFRDVELPLWCSEEVRGRVRAVLVR
jgi:enoyl-CoA hydratase/carnithine racemase